MGEAEFEDQYLRIDEDNDGCFNNFLVRFWSKTTAAGFMTTARRHVESFHIPIVLNFIKSLRLLKKT